jgi:hypothetical protein
LRANLEGAAKARASLEAAVRALGRGGRSEDEETVQLAINEAVAVGGHLLEEDVERAKDVLHRWRGAAASEAKLARALKEGANTAHLARAIQVRLQHVLWQNELGQRLWCLEHIFPSN